MPENFRVRSLGFRTINGLCVVILVIVGLSSSLLTVHAVVTYSPAVSAGQWAKYAVLYDRCEPANSPSCQSYVSGSINDTSYGIIQIIGVSGTIITFQLFTQFKNGTSSTQGAQVDVASGVTNVTIFGNSALSDYLILAGSLAWPDPVWNVASAPSINQTSSEQILGSSRTLNFLNRTSSHGILGFSISESTGFAFDQQSGLLVEAAYNYTITSILLGNSQIVFAIGMSDNNVWLSSSLPDFSISPVASMTFASGSSDSTTVTITGDSGFTSTVKLSVNTPAGLTCTLSPTNIQSSGSSTLTCRGQPGTYTVTISASSYFSHSVQTTATITAAADFSIGTISPITFQTGSSGTATITFTGQNGFTSDITLTVFVTSGLTCTLDHNVIHGSGTVTLTCNGQPGTYTVKVDAASGGTSHSAQTSVTVNSAPVSNQPPNGLPLAYIYAGAALAVVAAIAAVLFFVRRKPSSQKKPETMAPV